MNIKGNQLFNSWYSINILVLFRINVNIKLAKGNIGKEAPVSKTAANDASFTTFNKPIHKKQPIVQHCCLSACTYAIIETTVWSRGLLLSTMSLKVGNVYVCREHDKDPDTFFQAMFSLTEEGVPFHLSVLGETFTDVPGKYS